MAVEEFTGLILGLLCIISILIALEIITIGLRLWVRLGITKNFGTDDCILIASFLINTASFGLFLWIHHEQERYPRDSPALFNALSTPYLFCLAGYISASVLVKFTIAAFFKRLVRQRWQKIAIFLPLAIYCLCLLGLLLVALFRCGVPIRSADVMGKEDCAIRGFVLRPLALTAASLNAICDWAFAIIPVHMLITSEKMNRRARLSACVVIFLAVLGSIISLIRIAKAALLDASFGPTAFNSVPEIFSLSVIETFVAGITISLAVLAPLITRALGPTASETQPTIGGQGRPRTMRAQAMQKLRLASPAAWGKNQIRPIRGLGLLPDATTFSGTLMTVRAGEEEEEDAVPLNAIRLYASHMPMPSIAETLQWDLEKGVP